MEEEKICCMRCKKEQGRDAFIKLLTQCGGCRDRKKIKMDGLRKKPNKYVRTIKQIIDAMEVQEEKEKISKIMFDNDIKLN